MLQIAGSSYVEVSSMDMFHSEASLGDVLLPHIQDISSRDEVLYEQISVFVQSLP